MDINLMMDESSFVILNGSSIGGGGAVAPEDPSDSYDTWSSSEIVEMFYQVGFFVIGAPINVLALRNISKKALNRHSNELRLVRLSSQLLVAHLLVLCIYCLWRTFWMWNIIWTLGNVTCKLYSFLSALPFHLWSNIVAAIAIDTLYCVALPLSSVQNGNKRVSWLIGMAWFFAILCASPMFFFRGTVNIPETELYQCYHLSDEFSDQQMMTFHIFHVVTTFYIPLATIVVCYFFIWLSLRNQATLRKDMAKCSVPESMRGTTKRFLKATIAIVFTFVLTWLPYQVMALLRVVCEDESQCEKIASNFNWLQSILLASTCLNPFLYRFGIFRSSTKAFGQRAFLFHADGGAEGASTPTQKQSNASVFASSSPTKSAFDRIFCWGFHSAAAVEERRCRATAVIRHRDQGQLIARRTASNTTDRRQLLAPVRSPSSHYRTRCSTAPNPNAQQQQPPSLSVSPSQPPPLQPHQAQKLPAFFRVYPPQPLLSSASVIVRNSTNNLGDADRFHRFTMALSSADQRSDLIC